MARVDLGDGEWMDLRDDMTMEDVERIARNAQVWDASAGQWRTELLRGAIESVALAVVEWAVTRSDGEVPPVTPDGLRSLPIRKGLAVQREIDNHIAEQGLTLENLGGAS